MTANFFQSLDLEGRILGRMQRQIGEPQKADRRYWRDIIGELKVMRAKGFMVEEGSPV